MRERVIVMYCIINVYILISIMCIMWCKSCLKACVLMFVVIVNCVFCLSHVSLSDFFFCPFSFFFFFIFWFCSLHIYCETRCVVWLLSRYTNLHYYYYYCINCLLDILALTVYRPIFGFSWNCGFWLFDFMYCALSPM